MFGQFVTLSSSTLGLTTTMRLNRHSSAKNRGLTIYRDVKDMLQSTCKCLMAVVAAKGGTSRNRI